MKFPRFNMFVYLSLIELYRAGKKNVKFFSNLFEENHSRKNFAKISFMLVSFARGRINKVHH